MILDGYRNGRPTKDIAKEIQHIYGVNKRHAQFIAREPDGKAHAQISRKQQEDAGVKEYVWSTSGDSRVRDSHRALNKKRFRWDDPPVVDIKAAEGAIRARTTNAGASLWRYLITSPSTCQYPATEVVDMMER